MRRTKQEKTKYTATLAVIGAVGISLAFGGKLDRSVVSAADLPEDSATFLADAVLPVTPSEAVTPVNPTFVHPKYIIHAGGNYGLYTVTNSAEAMEQLIAAGQPAVELDFALTSDGYPVCIHDWNYHYLPEYRASDFPLPLNRFETAKLCGTLATMTLDDVAFYLESTPELMVITDAKDCQLELLSRIAEKYPDLRSRFLIQIYDIDEYDAFRALGFDNIIFTLYMLDNAYKSDGKMVIDLIGDRKLWGITFPVELASQEGYVGELLKGNIPLYVHTVNDPDEIRALLESGITGVYTDLLFTE